MLGHIERHYPLYTTDQLFELVADVEKYPEFLPWILSSRILRREPNVVWVDMTLGIGPLQQRFTSQGVPTNPALKGPNGAPANPNLDRDIRGDTNRGPDGMPLPNSR